MENIILLFICGGCGALIKDILADNCLKLPTISNGAINLGCLGAMIIGAFAGWAIDGSYLTAFTGGIAGSVVIAGLVPKTEIKLTAIEQ
jgi:hypothetical protein